MKTVFLIGFIFLQTGLCFGQQNLPQGYSYHPFLFHQDSVHILIYRKPGEEQIKKPLFIFVQGSLPIPLIISDGDVNYGIFPFNPDSLASKYHLVIVGKPGLPLRTDVKGLNPDFTYNDPSTNKLPLDFTHNDYPLYYAKREQKVIQYLQKQKFVSKNELVIAGHSAGATIAVQIARLNKKVTKLIYACGNPYGRIVTIVASAHKKEQDTISFAANEFEYWKNIVNNPSDTSSLHGNTNKTMWEYSKPVVKDLWSLKIPILVVYASKDASSPYCDLLQINAIRDKKSNIHFQCYTGLEHNFFGMNSDGTVNYEDYRWDQVGKDWSRWLSK
jgi:pimeloyl-ACP methyl ester carboxylesterase